jgi:non-canonical (house-cleaning) NTP pyrophosphatase
MNKAIRRILDSVHVVAVRVEDTRGPHPTTHDYIYIVAHATARWTDRMLH